MVYKGSCHCGSVAYEVEGEIDQLLSCNCSICQRKGSLLWFVGRGQLRFTQPETNATEYLFNKHVIHHRFCPTCGIHPYAVGQGPNGPMAAINARCLEDVDLGKFKVVQFDGRSK